MIFYDIFGLSLLKTYSLCRSNLLYYAGGRTKSRRRLWREKLHTCRHYEDFLKIRIATQELSPDPVDAAMPLRRSTSFGGPQKVSPSRSLPRNRSFSGEHVPNLVDPLCVQELGKMADLLSTTAQRLSEARTRALDDPEAVHTLQYLLSGVVKRNHLGLEDILVENARGVLERGQYGLTQPTRQLIRQYYEQVEKGLEFLAEAPVPHEEPPQDGFSLDPKPSELVQRINLVRKMKHNVGRTALMLSGGGAQAMYHLGAIRALIEAKLYDNIKVISGTSGGSIIAAMCAIKTSDELYREVAVSNVSTDYMQTGEMKKLGIRWFPKPMEMAAYWFKHKLLVDSKYFRRTCEFYYKDITFEEAFLRTGKHVCITVSASRATGSSAQRLLLNHISTPHVTIASAVAASCALPGVMAPAKLLSKNQAGVLEPFEVDGVEWIDGSVQADLPFQRIASLFAVTSYIVSQTNFHVVPLLNKAHHPSQKSLYWRMFQMLEWDIRGRALKLSRLGLFPKMFGQDISKVFKQKYHGNLTIVPQFTTMQTFGLMALANPSEKDMEGYLKYGQHATWPYLNAIRDMIRLETSLDECLLRLEERLRQQRPDVEWSAHDEIESIASGSAMISSARVRIIGRPPSGGVSARSDNDRSRIRALEDENQSLRRELEEMRMKLAHSDIDSAVENVSPSPPQSPSVESEGQVLSLMRQHSKSQ